MPRSEEAEWWANAVYEAIQEIPPGKLNALVKLGFVSKSFRRRSPVGAHFNNDNVPWQRVINSKGMISHRGPGSAQRQAEALQSEGVEVTTDSMGEIYVSLAQYGWFPKHLPSEEGGEDEEE
ncbi:unnamed protein product [Penicillium salamii]|nr:unnamed protein product [Penicillium salamii]